MFVASLESAKASTSHEIIQLEPSNLQSGHDVLDMKYDGFMWCITEILLTILGVVFAMAAMEFMHYYAMNNKLFMVMALIFTLSLIRW